MSHPLCIVVVVQLSSTPVRSSDAIEAVNTYLSSSDVSTMSGEAAAHELEEMVPALRKLLFRSIELGAQAITNNHHNTVGARSGAAWFASVMGVPNVLPLISLGAIKAMELNPDVAIAAESGELSFEKATLVTRMAKNNVAVTEELMAHAVSDSYEALRRRAQDLHANSESTKETRAVASLSIHTN